MVTAQVQIGALEPALCGTLPSVPIFDAIASEVRSQLHSSGFVIFEAPHSDREGTTLLESARGIGVLEPHDMGGSLLWDVRPMGAGPDIARSHTLDEFPLHTDAAFEPTPPRYVGMQVIHADRCGGGQSKLFDARAAVWALSAESRECLETEPVLWRVPKEFRKGSDVQEACVLGASGALRYRPDIIVYDALSARQFSALAELRNLIESNAETALFDLPDFAVILIDNWRMVHGRSEIIDPERHLKRVRFRSSLSERF